MIQGGWLVIYAGSPANKTRRLEIIKVDEDKRGEGASGYN